MRFGILGSLEAEDDGHSLTPSAPKQRQLLALLLANAGRTVPASTCIDELWDEDPPESARSTLQTYVMHIRKYIGRAPGADARGVAQDRLVTANGGYLFVTRPGELDLDSFRTLARTGREALQAGEDVRAATFLRKALEVWRGTALVDVPVGPLLRTYATGLEEHRLNVLEQRIEAELRLGRHHELLSELSELVTQHPMNENMHAQFMLALYRSGRLAHALQVFRDFRGRLRRDVGIEPSPRLRSVHEAILREDPVLDIAAHTGSRLSLDLVSYVTRRTPVDSLFSTS